MDALFSHVDCIELYVSDLDAGIAYYCDSLGLKLLWRTQTTVGLGMAEGVTEVVLQTERKQMNVDFKVDSVVQAVEKIVAAGGRVLQGPFDIPIGQCAVVQDKWENAYVILDMTRGRYIIDDKGAVVGVQKDP
ncbi:MAG: bleomycin resistance protein [Ruminococcaceae bacterium]|nr:bleomycin resistance protein [Oscillospiraceae bacterium]